MSIRILVLSEQCPKPDFHSGDRRFVALLALMARSHHVDYIALRPDDSDPQGLRHETLTRVGVRVRGIGWASLVKALASAPYHAIFCERYDVFRDNVGVLKERQPNAVLVVDSIDVHFARQQAAVRLGLQSEAKAAATRESELAAYRKASAVIVVTEEDAHILRHEGAMPPLFVLPNVVPLRDRPDCTRGTDVLFVGGFHHEPNLDAVRWFVQDIWPSVRQTIPTAAFTIVGSNPPAEVRALASVPGVRVAGYVPDTAPFLDAAAVSIAPLRYGAGMKGKVNEAMASGVPVVSTSFGVQGMPVVHGTHALVADAADDFADAVISLLKNPTMARAVGVAGQQVARIYSPENVGALLETMMRELVPHPKAPGPRVRWFLANARVGLRAAFRTAGFVPRAR